ncbi:prolyl oligopeptidase family serine peptidase [Aliiglaciecola litoralis]|uniref:prolyl oligopeptidase n=1 Tax=Aliiglaciecola litoralis TaxID=582857 RepID=A0ABN1LM03_9ALTE
MLNQLSVRIAHVTFTPFSTIMTALFFTVAVAQANPIAQPKMLEPEPAKDIYHGMTINDPFRQVENMTDPKIERWMKDQSQYTRKVLDSISGRDQLLDEMKKLESNKSAFYGSLTITDNGYYFFTKRQPKEEVSRLYYRKHFKDEDRLLFDPTTFAPDSEQKYVFSEVSPSSDGASVAFQISPDGSEDGVLLVMDVASQKLYPEQVDKISFASVSWTKDNKGFVYHRMPDKPKFDKDSAFDSSTYFHQLNSNYDQDKVVLSRKNNPNLGIKPEEFPVVQIENQAAKLLGFSYSVQRELISFIAEASELTQAKINWKPLLTPEDEVRKLVVTDDAIYAFSAKNAPNFQILKMPIDNPDIKKASVVVAEPKVGSLTSFAVNKDGIYYATMKNGVSAGMHFLAHNGKQAKEIKLPFPAGRLSLESHNPQSSDIWIEINGWLNDYQRFRYDIKNQGFIAENLTEPATFSEFENFVVNEIEVPSHDGVMVPVSLIHQKGIELNGSHATLLWGYGSYGYSMRPFFSTDYLSWVKQGGIIAVSHVRGGGELGAAWHKAGQKVNKPNTWKDLIATAEFLIKNKYASSQKIAIMGGSAGGILVGRAMTERPDLFAAVIPLVGAMNPIRMEETPNGPVNTPEFGTVKDKQEFLGLVEMDSYHHIKDGEQYPATLVTAGMNDLRVIAWQPAKFAARLMHANASDNPILLWVDFDTGHGIGNERSKTMANRADWMSFAFWQTGHPNFKLTLDNN